MAITGNAGGKAFFTKTLLAWHTAKNTRQMPWKSEKDAYKIWISEIILQQTRVQQGWKYYERFIDRYPRLQQLAEAEDSEVFKLWEGLGYYSRCKNIIASARYVVNELQGKFPDNFESLLQLKGVGRYTAAAIASFAYNQPHAVLDGNVFRVLSRFFGIFTPTDGRDKDVYFLLAEELLDRINPAAYNQAIMDFGATICKPKLPLCDSCPFQRKCFAYLNRMIQALPVKEKKLIRKRRWFYYLFVQFQNKVYVRKRTGKDIWQNLNEFILIEGKTPLSPEALQRSALFVTLFGSADATVVSISRIYKQQLTHQTITGRFLKIHVQNAIAVNGYDLVTEKQLNLLPFPKFITAYLKD